MKKVSFFQDKTTPSGLVVTLDELKAWLKIDSADEDAELTMILNAAQDKIACFLNVSLLPYEVYGNYSGFEVSQFERYYFISFKKSPLTSIDDVEYWDGTAYVGLTVSDDYLLEERDAGFPRILFKNTGNISADDSIAYPIRITASIGYANAAAVPDLIKTAILMYSALLYNNRGDCEECACDGDGTATIPCNIRAAISKYKLREVFA